LAVRSASGGSIGLAVRGSLFTAFSVGSTASTTSSRANRSAGIREIAETVSFDTTEYTRDTSSLPLYDGSSFDLVNTPCVTSDVEINSGGLEYCGNTSVGKQLVVGANRASLPGGRRINSSRVNASTVDRPLGSSQRHSNKSRRVGWKGDVGCVGLRSLMAAFASTTVSNITIANLTKVGSSGRRDSLGIVSESSRWVQQIDRGEPITAELVIDVRGDVSSSIKTRSLARITKTSTDLVRVAKRERRCGKAVSVLFASTN
jgi:hypothetical protein